VCTAVLIVMLVARESSTPSSVMSTAVVDSIPLHTEAESPMPQVAVSHTNFSEWRRHMPSNKGQRICFEDLQAWMPCDDAVRCEKKRRISSPCRDRVFYDDDVWDFCNPAARLNKTVYVMNPPKNVVNRSVSVSDVWRTISLPLREVWRGVQYTAGRVTADAASRRVAASELDHGFDPEDMAHCAPERRRAIVAFAAKFMRPFQIMALVLSAFRAMGSRTLCTRMHIFVSDPESPLLLHLQALTTVDRWGRGSPLPNVEDMSPVELLEAKHKGLLQHSFLVVEPFNVFEARVLESSGNNRRVEVMRINVARRWLRHGGGRSYHQFVFVDSRDAVFMGDVFKAVQTTLQASFSEDANNSMYLREYMYAASEEFPFFRQPRLGLKWNVEVHATTFGADMMKLMELFHLDDYPFMRLINSGVYGGTYGALVDLFEIWGKSTAAVFTETFGVDQPLLGGLMYFGLSMTHYPHPSFLISGSDGPLRHLYTDGGTDPKYPFMRLELHDGTRMWSDAYMRRLVENQVRQSTEGDDGNRTLDPALTGGYAQAPSPHQLNCRGERYAILHQSDRYPLIWRSLTVPIASRTVAWAQKHRVEWTWGPPRPAKKRKGARG
jgi:hypothetical protein